MGIFMFLVDGFIAFYFFLRLDQVYDNRFERDGGLGWIKFEFLENCLK